MKAKFRVERQPNIMGNPLQFYLNLQGKYIASMIMNVDPEGFCEYDDICRAIEVVFKETIRNIEEGEL